MTLDHAVVGSVVPDTGGTTGSDCKLAAHLRSPREPRLEKNSRVEFMAAAAVLAVEFRWSLEPVRACSAVR